MFTVAKGSEKPWAPCEQSRNCYWSWEVEAVSSWPTPVDLKEVHRFVGFYSYYWKFIPDFANIAHPLHQCIETFNRRTEVEAAFQHLKQALTCAQVILLLGWSTYLGHRCQQQLLWELFYPKCRMEEGYLPTIAAALIQLRTSSSRKSHPILQSLPSW